jgi:hypothetical protein
MRLGEILDGSFNIYRRHFGLFMRLSLILVWLPTAAGIYLNLRFANSPFELLALFEQNIGGSIGIFVLFLVVWSACSLMLKAGTIKVISDSYLGHEPELGASLRFGVERIIPLLLVTLSKTLLFIVLYVAAGLVVMLLYFMGRIFGTGMGGLLAFVGAVAAVWLVIWIQCGYGMTTPSVVLEDLSSSFDAFGRSWELTRGARGKVAGTIAVTSLISQFLPGVVIGSISAVIGTAGNESFRPIVVVVSSLIGIVLAPILPCALTLLYYDLRVRREAFDIQVLSEQLGMGIH